VSAFWAALIEVPCRICGERSWRAVDGGLCVFCLDIREWATINRTFRDVLHRGAALPPYAADRTMAFRVEMGVG